MAPDQRQAASTSGHAEAASGGRFLPPSHHRFILLQLPLLFLLLLLFFCGSTWKVSAADPGAARPADGQFVFAFYNLENYLLMPRTVGGKRMEAAPKPEQSIKVLVRILSEIRPDVLGVSEIGDETQVRDLQRRLREAGVDLPDFEWVQAADQERHIALLTRFPIVARQSVTDLTFDLGGKPQPVKRGFLDVTIEICPGREIRFIGAHLKSKRPVPEGEALLRRHEAHLLRRHLDTILAQQTEEAPRLVVYGDFNDLRNEPPVREIIGPRGDPGQLITLDLADEHGDRWTHYWAMADLYSRIDYIMVSRAMRPMLVPRLSRVYRSPDWREASDHRPLVAVFKCPQPARYP